MNPGQYPLDLIQSPQDIENFDELDDQYAYIKQDEPIPPLPQDQKLLQIKNNLATIADNLYMFSDLIRTINNQVSSKPIQVNTRERAMNELNKAYACKLKFLGEIKTKHYLQDYLNTKNREQDKIESSLQKISKQFAFASSQQLGTFARAFKPPFDIGNFIYANLYHDKISGDFPYLKLTKQENQLILVRDSLNIEGENYFIIDIQGTNKRWISLPPEKNSIYEKMIYDYIVKAKETKRNILNYTIEFKYIKEDSPDFMDIKTIYEQNQEILQNILFAKLLHELIFKGSLETYFQFIKLFILEQENQEITDQQRYHNLLSHLTYPEQIQGVGK